MNSTLSIPQFVIDHVSEAVFLIGPDAHILDVNAAACKSLGYIRDELLQMSVCDIDPIYTCEQWPRSWQEFKAQGSVTFESLHQTRDGKQFPVEINASFFSHENEEYICALVRDITKRKRTEEAIQESEERFRSLVETTDEWIWAIDLNGRHTYSNPSIETILGYTPEEIVGTQSLSLLHEQDQKKVAAALPTFINSKTAWKGWILRWRHKDGSYKYLESNATPIMNSSGEITGFRGVDRDISQQRQALKELREEQERTRQYLEVAGVIMLSLDINGKVQMINRKGCEILGYPKEEILQRDWFSNFLPSADAEPIRASFKKLIEGNISPMEYYENPVRTRGDGLRLIAWRNVLLTDSEGHITGVLASGADITDQRQAELEVKQANTEWNYAMDFFDEPIYLLDLERRIVRANQAFYKLTHSSKEAVIGRHIAEILHPQGEESPCPVCRAQEEKRDTVITMETDHADNPTGLPIEVICRVIRNHVNEPTGILMTIRDLSRARQTQEKLSQSAAVFESTIEGIMITDPDLNIIAINPAFTNITGYTEAEAIGETPRLLKSERHKRDFYRELWDLLNKNEGWQGEIWNRRKNGEIYPEWLTISIVRDDNGKISNYIGVFSDISQLKQSQTRLEFLAHHDPLTSLPNRLLFGARLEHAIERARRNEAMVALLFLDLDRFKHINDSLGHTVGDALLEAVAQRFTELTREDDTVARLGGDEFVILMEEIDDSEYAAVLAEKIIKSLSAPFNVLEHELFVGTSIGISLFPQDGDNVEQLLSNADSAMYRAKDLGRSNYQFYTKELTAHAFEHMLLGGQLRKAIEQEQFVIHYQPQIDLINNKVIGVEALIRWQHPEHGLIPPGQFIPLAEDTNLIIPLGDWVLREACKQANSWLDAGIEFGYISVNVAGPQIHQDSLLKTVSEILTETKLPPERLELEITETFIMEQDAPAIELLLSLRRLGVSLAIDDFGTGYSSLSYLKQLPVNKLKIDRSFVNDLPEDENDAAITRAIIALGHSMLFTVIAEGVETETQRNFLIKEGCEQAQGYLYSKPVSADKITILLRNGI
jgi:diguanylate cyclase (GGDEF)-like protein/PAS domain S-box-containing protein